MVIGEETVVAVMPVKIFKPKFSSYFYTVVVHDEQDGTWVVKEPESVCSSVAGLSQPMGGELHSVTTT
jgi:hypothetical protein